MVKSLSCPARNFGRWLPVLFLVCGMSLDAQPFSPNDQANSLRDYGVNKADYDKIVALVARHAKPDELQAGGYNATSDGAVGRLVEILPLIYQHDKDELLATLTFLKAALRGKWDISLVRNPLVAMVQTDDFATFQKALAIDRELAYVATQFWESSAPTPIAEVVKAGKTEWLKYLITNKYDLNRDPVLTSGKNDRYWVANLLTVAPTPDIDKLLVQAGVRDVLATEWYSRCLDDNVRVRDAFGLNGKVLFKIAKGTEVGRGVWLKVDVGGKVGWLFSVFAWLDDEV